MSQMKEQYLDVADRIGRNLCRDAVWDVERCTWLGWTLQYHQGIRSHFYRSLQGDLYGGTAGIALFLLELYQFTQDKQQLRCIDGALNQALSLVEKGKANRTASFFSGQTGLAFVLAKAAQMTGRAELYEYSKEIVSGLRDAALDPIAIDVVTGSAGAIPVLIQLASILACDEAIDIANMHGQHLLARAVVRDDQASWQTSPNEKDAHLNGYSHGASGIATALLELYAATKNNEYVQVALQALRFERMQLNRQVGNWPDHRNTSVDRQNRGETFSLAWCHGAPGIGLARLRQSQLLSDDVEIKEDLETALTTTMNSLLRPWKDDGRNFSLCHGESGNADLLIQASHDLQRPNLLEVAEQVGQNGIQHILQKGRPWPCGNSGAGETPSLMLGTAGIGHFYLRLFSPQRVPSILITRPI